MIDLLAAAALGSAVICAPAPTPVNDTATAHYAVPHESLRELYEEGLPFAEFLDRAEARKPLWHENWGEAAVPDALLEKARAVTGSWRILAVAIDACSDSVNSIPYVAKLADLVPGLDMRIIDSKRGRAIMEAHRTPDGRAATPTLILIDASWEEAGCWIERPLQLQTWYAARQREGLPVSEITQQKMAWYKDNAGREILSEVVGMIEAAARGYRVCASDAG
jgi:Thioredoxin